MARNNGDKPILVQKKIEKPYSPDMDLVWLNGKIRAAGVSGGEKGVS